MKMIKILPVAILWFLYSLNTFADPDGGYKKRGTELPVKYGQAKIEPSKEVQKPDGRRILWYRTPAKDWLEALPIGNGYMGAMVYGGADLERIQFNEDTLWTGHPQDYQNEGAAKYLPQVRKLLFDGKQKEAEKLANEHCMSDPIRQEMYQPFGDLVLTFPDSHKTVSAYRRWLDLDKAAALTEYSAAGVKYTRKIIASYPDHVIAMQISADKGGSVAFSADLMCPHEKREVVRISEDTIALRGQVTRTGRMKVESRLKFEARLKVVSKGGKVSVTNDKVRVTGADSAVLILTAATSYKNYRDLSADPGQRCERILGDLKDKSFEDIRTVHEKDHQKLFRRVSIDLGRTPNADFETDRRLKEFKSGKDPDLAALHYQYGRYLLIACSRPGSQPANLQGIWNHHVFPPWECKYTVNINTEMNYWPAELTNLSECHEPLFAMLEDCSKTGALTAKTFYDCEGWVLHHNIDIWRGTAPINGANHGIWVVGGAWLCQHFWFRYDFTGDHAFLKNRAYPIMKKCAEFFVDFLIEEPKLGKGWLISGPSNSPEHGGLVMGPAMDHQIIRNLFGNCIEASRILDVDEPFRKKLIEMRKRIVPDQVGSQGQLKEWLYKENPKTSHRHVSHLWALHPGRQITRRGTPELWKAAMKTLQLRGDGGTGWSMAWKINFWTRFEDGDHAYVMLRNLLTPGRSATNLFDLHPPFQIDGNFGSTSGITEMIVQSHAGEIHLLPALPSAWPSGSLKGVCARGAFVLDITWKDGKLLEAIIKSRVGNRCRVRYGEKTAEFDTEKGKSYRIDGDLKITGLDTK